MSVNPKGSGFFSKTPLTAVKATESYKEVSVDPYGDISSATIGLSTGTFGIGSITGTTTSSNIVSSNYDLSKTLDEYKKKVSDLHAENLYLETKLHEANKKLLKGKEPLIAAEAKLTHLRDTLLKVKTSTMGDGVVGIVQSDWDAVLEALADSLHDTIALDKMLAKVTLKVSSVPAKKVKVTKPKAYTSWPTYMDDTEESEFDSEEAKTSVSELKEKYMKAFDSLSITKKPSVFNSPEDDLPF